MTIIIMVVNSVVLVGGFFDLVSASEAVPVEPVWPLAETYRRERIPASRARVGDGDEQA